MEKNGHKKITDLLALLVFGVFALCVAIVLLMGARTYHALTERGTESYDHRTGVRYMTTRFQQSESMCVEDFCGLSAMTIREEIGGKTYLTRVYYYEGSIRELYAAENAEVTPKDGEIILGASGLSFFREAQLLTVDITFRDGNTERLLLWLPQWKEASA